MEIKNECIVMNILYERLNGDRWNILNMRGVLSVCMQCVCN